MLIIQLNRNPNQEMMVSRINERNERKIGLQVCLGVGDLLLGEDLCQGAVAFIEASTPLPRRSSSHRQSSLHLSGELRDCTEMAFLLVSIENFQPKPNHKIQLKTTKNTYMEELEFPNPNIDNKGVMRVS